MSHHTLCSKRTRDDVMRHAWAIKRCHYSTKVAFVCLKCHFDLCVHVLFMHPLKLTVDYNVDLRRRYRSSPGGGCCGGGADGGRGGRMCVCVGGGEGRRGGEREIIVGGHCYCHNSRLAAAEFCRPTKHVWSRKCVSAASHAHLAAITLLLRLNKREKVLQRCTKPTLRRQNCLSYLQLINEVVQLRKRTAGSTLEVSFSAATYIRSCKDDRQEVVLWLQSWSYASGNLLPVLEAVLCEMFYDSWNEKLEDGLEFVFNLVMILLGRLGSKHRLTN